MKKLYKFEPCHDITARELATIVANMIHHVDEDFMRSITTATVRRHFKEMEQPEIPVVLLDPPETD